MDRFLISKYFSDQCSREELEQVLDWFQTQRGRVYLEVQIKEDFRRLMESKPPALSTVPDSKKTFKRILKNKNGNSSLNRKNQTSNLE